MFIKEVKKQNSKDGKIFFQYNLIQSIRIDGKPRQRNILYLGHHPLLQDKEKRKIIAQILEDKIYQRPALIQLTDDVELLALAQHYHEKYLQKYKDLDSDDYFSKPPTEETADFEALTVRSLDLNNSRTLGAERLCHEVLKKIGLDAFFTHLHWMPLQVQHALISIIGRAVFVSSEHKTAQHLQTCSALNELFNKDFDEVTRHDLYAISDVLYENKTGIDQFLYQRFLHMFDIEDKLVIYDLTNSYFEGSKQDSSLAQFGKNKQKRNDRKQVVFTGVINEHGFIRHSRIYEGNTADCVTLEDMLEDLKAHSPNKSKRIVVIDAGLATEDNLISIRAAQLTYVCVARTQMKDYAAKLSGQKLTIEDQQGSPIELIMVDDPTQPDRWMYVKSERKTRKERSMDTKLSERFEQDLSTAKASVNKKGGIKKIEKVYERIGRIKEKHKKVQAKYNITISTKDGKATNITWQIKSVDKNKTPTKLSALNHGVYFIRTNLKVGQEEQIWKVYNTIREVEATFRCLKSDLLIRPIHHQKDERVKAHIYLTLLAYQLVNTIRYLLKQKNLNYDWTNIVRIMNTQQMATIELKAEGKTIGIRRASRPSKEALAIYKAVGVSSMPKQKRKYVVYH